MKYLILLLAIFLSSCEMLGQINSAKTYCEKRNVEGESCIVCTASDSISIDCVSNTRFENYLESRCEAFANSLKQLQEGEFKDGL